MQLSLFSPEVRDDIPYRYGLEEIPSDITKQELLAYFSLDAGGSAFIREKCRLYHYRVALGVQIGAYRFIGRAQPYQEPPPPAVIRFVARTLKLKRNFVPLKLADQLRTYQAHSQIAREYLGLSFLPVIKRQDLIDHLVADPPDPGHLPQWIKNAEGFLRKSNYVLPSLKELKRLVISARHQSLEQVMQQINRQLGDGRKDMLEKLLLTGDTGTSGWNVLTRKNLLKATSEKISEVLNRIKEVRHLSLKELDFTKLPPRHVDYLVQQGIRASTKRLRDYAFPHRYAIMAVTLKELESELIDIAVQMNDEILSVIFLRGRLRAEKYLKKHRKTILRIVSAFRFMTGILSDDSSTPEEMVERIHREYSSELLQDLDRDATRLQIPRGTETIYFASRSYDTVRKYLPALLETFTIVAATHNDPVLEAVEYYTARTGAGQRGIDAGAPTAFVTEAKWKRLVFDEQSKPKLKPWVLCLADRLRKSFRQGSIEIEGTKQYRSLNSDLIPWPEWKTREKWSDTNIPFTAPAETVVTALFRAIQSLSGKSGQWFDETGATARIDRQNRLHLTKLEKEEAPEPVRELRRLIQERMPARSLAEIIVETDGLTGFSSYLTRLSSGRPIQHDERAAGLALYAVLLAGACNIPLTKMAASPGISLGMLYSVREETLRQQTLQAATAALVDFYTRLPLARIWGPGTTSSSDGQGFAAAGHPLGAVYNKKRFGGKRKGFIVYTHIADNYAPFYTQVISAAVREATYVLDGLLYHGSSLMPREHYTDSHGYTEIVFALSYLLGFRLAPRLANIPDLTLWHGKGYEAGRPELFDGKISLQSIANQWEDIQRVAESIHSGTARASQIIRKISAFSRRQPLFKALRNLGRLIRTRHILEMAGDKDYRRRILQGINKGESRNSLAKDMIYARQGNIYDKTPRLRLTRASSLNLAVLCIAAWNTVHMQRAIRYLRRKGREISEEDLRFLSPFIREHINLYGQFKFQPVPDLDPLSVKREFEPI